MIIQFPAIIIIGHVQSTKFTPIIIGIGLATIEHANLLSKILRRMHPSIGDTNGIDGWMVDPECMELFIPRKVLLYLIYNSIWVKAILEIWGTDRLCLLLNFQV